MTEIKLLKLVNKRIEPNSPDRNRHFGPKDGRSKSHATPVAARSPQGARPNPHRQGHAKLRRQFHPGYPDRLEDLRSHASATTNQRRAYYKWSDIRPPSPPEEQLRRPRHKTEIRPPEPRLMRPTNLHGARGREIAQSGGVPPAT